MRESASLCGSIPSFAQAYTVQAVIDLSVACVWDVGITREQALTRDPHTLISSGIIGLVLSRDRAKRAGLNKGPTNIDFLRYNRPSFVTGYGQESRP